MWRRGGGPALLGLLTTFSLFPFPSLSLQSPIVSFFPLNTCLFSLSLPLMMMPKVAFENSGKKVVLHCTVLLHHEGGKGFALLCNKSISPFCICLTAFLRSFIYNKCFSIQFNFTKNQNSLCNKAGYTAIQSRMVGQER